MDSAECPTDLWLPVDEGLFEPTLEALEVAGAREASDDYMLGIQEECVAGRPSRPSSVAIEESSVMSMPRI